MFFSAALAVSAFGLAQAATFDVIVGAGGLKYSPTSVTAAVGDTVNFVFNAPGSNHTVTLSSFATPCVATQPGVVDSGYNFVNKDDPTTFRNWSLTIDKTDPLWFYCAQGKHCQNGMVFAINPTAEKTFDKFLANAQTAQPAGNSTAPASSGAPAASGSASTTVSAAASGSASSSASAAGASGTAGAGNGAEILSRSTAGILAAVAGVAVILL